MKKKILSGICLTLLLLGCFCNIQAQNTKEAGDPPLAIKTKNSIQIDGKTINYTTTVGWLILKKNKDEPIARFGYTSYIRDDIADENKRPIMFAFNGGPGSSSVWLHMGVLGPKRVVVSDTGFTPPPALYVNNSSSIIDVVDLVMIDPVGTGFSKSLGASKNDDFWGVDQDIKSVGKFINKYVTENKRWLSPKYILGESYGAMRAAGLALHMQNMYNMNLNGVVFVSPFLSFISGSDGYYNDLGHVLFLPTLAATAWYHNLIKDKPSDLLTFLDEVESFANNEYSDALKKGYVISEDEKIRVAQKLGKYTGTSSDYWLKVDLRAAHWQFLQELQRENRMVIGRTDSRFIGNSINPISENMDYDPFNPSIGPAFKAAFMQYLYNDLKYDKEAEYVIWKSITTWDWKHKPPKAYQVPWEETIPWPDLRPDLSYAMVKNPNLYVLVQQGYFDLATPMHVMKYDVDHLDIPMGARDRISMEYYEAGHMMYIHNESRKKFREDLVKFILESDGF